MVLMVKLHSMELGQRCTNINEESENAKAVTKEMNLVLRNNERVH